MASIQPPRGFGRGPVTDGGPAADPSVPVALDTPGGRVECRYYEATDATSGVVCVGGAGGGWDTPALGLYPALALSLRPHGIAVLRVRFRRSTHAGECVTDVVAGMRFLQSKGIDRMALVGHSLGGAVVLRAAHESPAVAGVVTFAAQESGAGSVEELAPRCAVLLIHGTDDTVVPLSGSQRLYERAGEPRDLVVVQGGGHVLDEAAQDLHRLVDEWLRTRLTGDTRS
jgi:pimeloyl-ACP methyl ester carboxylesterase